ncbi:hypothetical protein [Nocardioides humi]|uniref:hypothetical protein n=1 Tax=Nocardioides humi TaxID=449461 RepID=UPI001127411D|nr:hypothetical protein [Nocardioides humi]
MGFAATYVDRVRGLLARLGTADGTIVVPVPPCLDSYDHDAFPVAGSPTSASPPTARCAPR